MRRVKGLRRRGGVGGTVAGFAAFPAGAFCVDMVGTWQTVLGRQHSPPIGVGNDGAPVDYDPLLLEIGRCVLVDLRKAHQAAPVRKPTNLQVDLQQERDTLRRLQQPARAMMLAAQLRATHDDLRSPRKVLDDWVPVEAYIDEVLVYRGGAAAARANGTVSPEQALLAAYNGVGNAYVLANDPAARPDRDEKSLDYLVQERRPA
jgi:hypothetical protein